MAAIAFMTLFAVSCGSDEEENQSFVGSKWISSNAISYMGFTGSYDFNLNVISEDSILFGYEINFMGQTETDSETVAYTLDNNQNLTLHEPDGDMTMTYDKDADTYSYIFDDDDDDVAEIREILGTDRITFTRVK